LPKRLLTKAIEKPIGGGGGKKKRKNPQTGGKNFGVTEKKKGEGRAPPGPKKGGFGICPPRPRGLTFKREPGQGGNPRKKKGEKNPQGREKTVPPQKGRPPGNPRKPPQGKRARAQKTPPPGEKTQPPQNPKPKKKKTFQR